MHDKNRVVIITGSSQGIGTAIARLVAQKGYQVGLHYHNSENEVKILAEQIGRRGGKAIPVRAEISDPDDVKMLFETVSNKFGPIYAVVNNAGMMMSRKNVGLVSICEFRRILDVNVLGSFLCMQMAVRYMSRKNGGQGGSIVNISSQVAKSGGNKLLPYAASKAAINALTLGLAREVASEGIRVNAVSPGVIDTRQHAGINGEEARQIISNIPMGRMGTPDEVAGTVLWLLSDLSSYVTGAIIPVSGGR